MNLTLPSRDALFAPPMLPPELTTGQRAGLAVAVLAVHGLAAWYALHWTVAPSARVEPPTITATLVSGAASSRSPSEQPATPPVTPPNSLQTRPPTERPSPREPLPAPARRPPPAARTAAAAPSPVPDSPQDARVPANPSPAHTAAPVLTPAPEAPRGAAVPMATPSGASVQPSPSAGPPVGPQASPPSESPRNGGSSTQPRELPGASVRYLVEPPRVYPPASFNMGETGEVHLRVLVDEAGRPKDVQLSKTSGYPRLDRQAILNMKQARFQPYVEAGVPRAVWVPAVIVFNLD